MCVFILLKRSFENYLPILYVFRLHKKAHLFQFITVYSCHDAMPASNHSRTLNENRGKKLSRHADTNMCACRTCVCVYVCVYTVQYKIVHEMNEHEC